MNLNDTGSLLTYPDTRRVDHVDILHGESIPDPYRWLEEIDSPKTVAWIQEQNELTQAYLKRIPKRAALCERLTELWNYEKFGLPLKRGDRYFFSRNDGLQNQSVLYWTASLNQEPYLLYERPDHKDWNFDGFVTEDDRYLIINVHQGTRRENTIFYQKLTHGEEDEAENIICELFAEFDASSHVICNDAPLFYIKTESKCSSTLSRVIAVNVDEEGSKSIREILPGSTDTLQSVRLIDQKFVATYLHHAHSRVHIFDKNGAHLQEIELPTIGTIRGFSGRQTDQETFYSFLTLICPEQSIGMIWRRAIVRYFVSQSSLLTLMTLSQNRVSVKAKMGLGYLCSLPTNEGFCAMAQIQPIYMGMADLTLHAPLFSAPNLTYGRDLRAGQSAWRWRVWTILAPGWQ